MRGLKSLLILIVVAAGLGAYIYFVESKKPAGGGGETRPKVFTVTADAISELTVRTAGGEQTRLKKSGANWEIVEPVAARADAAEVSGITSSLATVENALVVVEAPADLQQYGLAEPRVDVGFKAGADKDFRRLLVGDKTATGGEMYAMVGGEKRVFLIAGYLESTFDRTTFDLRDKGVLAFERDKVDRLHVVSPERTLRLSLAGGEWSLADPVQAPADYGAVEGLIGRLQSAQMKSIAVQNADDLKTYGLDQPEVTATVGTGSSQAALLVGKKADETTVYAKDASRPMVFTIESSLVDELKKPADDLRRKDLFASRSFSTTAIEIVRGAETVAFEKVKGTGQNAVDKWRETRPSAKDADSSKVETFLTKLSNLRAQSWADARAKTGLQAPAMTVTVKFDDGKREEKVLFGREGIDVYASIAGQPGAAKLDAAEFDDAVKALDAAK